MVNIEQMERRSMAEREKMMSVMPKSPYPRLMKAKSFGELPPTQEDITKNVSNSFRSRGGMGNPMGSMSSMGGMQRTGQMNAMDPMLGMGQMNPMSAMGMGTMGTMNPMGMGMMGNMGSMGNRMNQYGMSNQMTGFGGFGMNRPNLIGERMGNRGNDFYMRGTGITSSPSVDQDVSFGDKINNYNRLANNRMGMGMGMGTGMGMGMGMGMGTNMGMGSNIPAFVPYRG